jgi:hypothetical protein
MEIEFIIFLFYNLKYIQATLENIKLFIIFLLVKGVLVG